MTSATRRAWQHVCSVWEAEADLIIWMACISLSLSAKADRWLNVKVSTSLLRIPMITNGAMQCLTELVSSVICFTGRLNKNGKLCRSQRSRGVKCVRSWNVRVLDSLVRMCPRRVWSVLFTVWLYTDEAHSPSWVLPNVYLESRNLRITNLNATSRAINMKRWRWKKGGSWAVSLN
jgi:hypothetical protein